MIFATLLMICSVAVGVHVALTSPTPTPPKEQRVLHDFSTLSVAMNVYKFACLFHGIIEILIVALPAVIRQLPPSTTTQWVSDTFFELFLPSSLGETAIFFPPLRILGAFLILSGSAIRYMCFRELGRHFTFHITLLKNHTLVTTGPYSIVRHPSYGGTVILNTGSMLWHITSGSWLRQGGFYTNRIAWFTVFLPASMFIAASVVQGLGMRPQREDKILKKEFGKKWEEWAKRVPYRVFPGIY